MRGWLMAGLAIGIATSAAAREPVFAIATGAGPIVRIGCRQGECQWQRQQRAAIVRRSLGEVVVALSLREATTIHPGGASYPNAWRPGTVATWRDRTDYIRCSKTRPAVLWRDADGRFYLHQLSLRSLAGYQQNSAVEYMLTCHRRMPGNWNDRLLVRLGYGKAPSDQLIFDARDAALAAIGAR